MLGPSKTSATSSHSLITSTPPSDITTPHNFCRGKFAEVKFIKTRASWNSARWSILATCVCWARCTWLGRLAIQSLTCTWARSLMTATKRYPSNSRPCTLRTCASLTVETYPQDLSSLKCSRGTCCQMTSPASKHLELTIEPWTVFSAKGKPTCFLIKLTRSSMDSTQASDRQKALNGDVPII